MPWELPRIPIRWCGNPDSWKPTQEQQIEYTRGVTRTRLRLPYHRCANPGRVSQPQFMSSLREHFFEPMSVSARFHPHACRSRKGALERPGLARGVFQPTLRQLRRSPSLASQFAETTYENHTLSSTCSASFFRALVGSSLPSLVAHEEATPLFNQDCRRSHSATAAPRWTGSDGSSTGPSLPPAAFHNPSLGGRALAVGAHHRTARQTHVCDDELHPRKQLPGMMLHIRDHPPGHLPARILIYEPHVPDQGLLARPSRRTRQQFGKVPLLALLGRDAVGYLTPRSSSAS